MSAADVEYEIGAACPAGCGGTVVESPFIGCDTCEWNAPKPCPMGCGEMTDDAAGGPCSDCWDSAEGDTDGCGSDW